MGRPFASSSNQLVHHPNGLRQWIVELLDPVPANASRDERRVLVEFSRLEQTCEGGLCHAVGVQFVRRQPREPGQHLAKLGFRWALLLHLGDIARVHRREGHLGDALVVRFGGRRQLT